MSSFRKWPLHLLRVGTKLDNVCSVPSCCDSKLGASIVQHMFVWSSLASSVWILPGNVSFFVSYFLFVSLFVDSMPGYVSRWMTQTLHGNQHLVTNRMFVNFASPFSCWLSLIEFVSTKHSPLVTLASKKAALLGWVQPKVLFRIRSQTKSSIRGKWLKLSSRELLTDCPFRITPDCTYAERLLHFAFLARYRCSLLFFVTPWCVQLNIHWCSSRWVHCLHYGLLPMRVRT